MPLSSQLRRRGREAPRSAPVRRRYVCRDRGASAVEYGAVIVLVAAILGALVAAGVTTEVSGGVSRALCELTGSADCGADGGEPSPAASPYVWEGAEDDPAGGKTGQGDGLDKEEKAEADEAVETIDQYLASDNCGWFTCTVAPSDIDMSELSPKQREYVLANLEDSEIERLLGDNLVNSQGNFAEAMLKDASVRTRDRIAGINGPNAMKHTYPIVQTVAEREGLDLGIQRVPGASLYGESGEPSSADITQGYLGDCWWLTSLGAVADQNPDLIKDMIEDNGDGTYTVTFPDGEEVTVTDEFAWNRDTDAPAFARPSDSDDPAIWPMLMEKAYAQKKGGNYEDIEGGFAHFGMEDLTGDSGTTFQTVVPTARDYELPADVEASDVIEVDKEKHQESLLEAQENNEAMVAATYAPALLTEGRRNDYAEHTPPIVANHQYMVEEIDEETGDVTLINPHNPDIRTTVTGDEFYEYFPLVHTNPAGN